MRAYPIMFSSYCFSDTCPSLKKKGNEKKRKKSALLMPGFALFCFIFLHFKVHLGLLLRHSLHWLGMDTVPKNCVTKGVEKSFQWNLDKTTNQADNWNELEPKIRALLQAKMTSLRPQVRFLVYFATATQWMHTFYYRFHVAFDEIRTILTIKRRYKQVVP